jgi:hypothetical protein
MKTLSTQDLDSVTGGKNTSGSTPPTSGGGNNDQVLTTLQSIQSSLADLGKNQNQGLFGGQNGLMFMTMAIALSNRRSEVVMCGTSCRPRMSWRVW